MTSWSSPGFSLDEIEDPTRTANPAISIRSLKSALRRRRRLCVTLAVAGLLVGASLHLIIPSKYPAVTRLYLVEPSPQAISDDIGLLETQTVAKQAAATLHRSALSSYKGTEISQSVLSIKMSGPSQASSVAQANALAKAFLQVRARVLNNQAQIQVSRTQAQIDAIQSNIQRLGAQGAASQGSQQGDISNQLNGDTSQITQLKNQQQQALNNAASLTQGSSILDPAAAVPASKKKVILKDALSGLVAGLALGLIIAILGDLLSDRVRRRAEVAATLEMPVELSVGHLPRPRWFVGPRLRRAVKHPGAAMQRIEHRLRDHLPTTPVAELSLVEIGASKAAAVTLAMLGMSLASEGKRVMFFDAADGRPLATILGSKRAGRVGGTASLNGHQVGLVVAPDDPAQIASMDRPEDVDVILTLATVDPALGVEHISPALRSVVVMIRAGGASRVHIDAVNRLLRQAGVDVGSAVLIDADPDDHSSGLPTLPAPANDTAHRPFGAVKAVGP